MAYFIYIYIYIYILNRNGLCYILNVQNEKEKNYGPNFIYLGCKFFSPILAMYSHICTTVQVNNTC